ncbi:MAG: hypothetical protein JRH10_10430 [Deltaproteobacteria bacterium]|nr:hypothetical protein [Deltaproteobacteria bacterium]
MVGLVGCPPSPPPVAREGMHPHEAIARVAVPGGAVSVAGGALHVARRLMVIETRLGPLPLEGLHDSVGQGWRWSFELTLLDGVFTDAGRVAHDVSALAPGDVVPGSDWVVLDSGRMKTRGGLVHEFDAAGRLAAVHWASDEYPRVRYGTGLVGEQVRVVTIDQCTAPTACEPVYDLGWDAQGRLLEVEDRTGRRAELDWDAAGRLAAARDAGDVADGWPGARYFWVGDALESLVTSDGERIEFHFVAGRVAAVVADGPGSPTHTFAYARLADGTNRTLHEAPTGERTAFIWDGQRRLVERTLLDLDEDFTFTWDGLRVIREVGPDGYVAERSWLAGWLVSETDPGGNVRAYQWDPQGVNRVDPNAGAPSAISDVLGPLLAVVYDADGRPVELTDGVGDVTRLAWSGVELASLEPPAGPLREFEAYGEHGKPTRILVGGAVADEPLYDGVGNRLSSRDLSDPTSTAIPGIVARSFDADRRVATVVLLDEGPTHPLGEEQTLRIHRRADGRPLRIERPYGGDTEHSYDALGRRFERRERIDGAWQATTFSHDAAGRLLGEAKPNGMARAFGYDAAGRVVTATALRDGVAESTLTTTWVAGRVVERHDSVQDASEFYTYDAAGRPEHVTHAFGEATEIAYDLRGRATSVTLRLPDGTSLRTLAMLYDGADREIAIHDGDLTGPEILGRGYLDGRLVETRYGNGLVRDYAFDEVSGAWAGATTAAADGSWVEETTLAATGSAAYALVAFTTRTADPLGLVPAPPPGSDPGEVSTKETFSLDAGYGARPGGLRLRFADLEGSFDFGHSGFDALGNRLEVAQQLEATYETRGFVYNAEHNRLLEAQRFHWEGSQWVGETYRTWEWDEAGYATAVDGAPILWNAQGRITAAGGVASFVWDAAGRPVSRTVMGEETVHWFGGRLEAGAGELPSHLDLGEVRLDLDLGDHRYRHYGPRRNVKFVTDAAGQVVAHHHYGSYRRVATYGPDADTRGYAGGTHAGGFVVLGARVLDPEAGRFLSPDPIEQLLDPYAYTWGNPIQLWDPSGFQAAPAPSGPPVAATVFQIIGGSISAVGLVIAPFFPAAGGSLFLLGIALQQVATGIRDDAARRDATAGSGAVPSIPPLPTSPETSLTCVDGFCFGCVGNHCVPDRFGPGGGGGGGGGRGGGASGFSIDLGSAGCSTPGVCVLGPLPLVFLPTLLRVRRRWWRGLKPR